MISIDTTGRTVVIVVLIDRIRTWFIDTLTSSAGSSRSPRRPRSFSSTLS